MSLPYFNLYTSNWRDGVRGLKADEVGVYINVLTLIYDADGSIADDDVTIADKIGFDVRLWRRVRARLIALDKILLKNGRLSNKKADGVIADRNKFSERQASAGAAGGKASGKARRKPKITTKNTPENTPQKAPRKTKIGETSRRHLRDISEMSPRCLGEVGTKTAKKQPLHEATTLTLTFTDAEATPSGAASAARDAALKNPLCESGSPKTASKPSALKPIEVFGVPEPPSPKFVERKRLLDACYAVAGPGLADPVKHHSLDRSAPSILAALTAKCDFDQDILPVIEAITRRPLSSPIVSWGYFTNAWLEARDRRLAQLPPPDPNRFAGDNRAQGNHSSRSKRATGSFVDAALRRCDREGPADARERYDDAGFVDGEVIAPRRIGAGA